MLFNIVLHPLHHLSHLVYWFVRQSLRSIHFLTSICPIPIIDTCTLLSQMISLFSIYFVDTHANVGRQYIIITLRIKFFFIPFLFFLIILYMPALNPKRGKGVIKIQELCFASILCLSIKTIIFILSIQHQLAIRCFKQDHCTYVFEIARKFLEIQAMRGTYSNIKSSFNCQVRYVLRIFLKCCSSIWYSMALSREVSRE